MLNMFNKKSLRIFLLLALVLSLTLTGCQNNNEVLDESSTEEAVNETIQVVDEDETIVLAGKRHLAPGEEDGYYCSSILYVWEPLIRQGKNGEPLPSLAEDWEMSEDGKEWIFKLREGVTFHDGQVFNADAVIANFDRMSLGIKPSSYYPLDIDSHYPGLVSYEKIDDYNIKLVFDESKPTQLYRMINWGSAIYSPENFDEEGNFNGIAMGTGPFKIVDNQKDDYVLLERYEDYWGESAKAKSIKVRSIPDVDTRYSALKAGEIHGTLDLDSLTPALAEELKKDDNFLIAESKSTMIRFLVTNGELEPFNDIRLKEAISLALNRQDIVDIVYFGYGSPTTNILNYSTPFYKEYPVEENMERAKELAKEVLGEERLETEFLINGNDPTQKTEAELIAPWLAEIGIDVTIQPMEYSVLRERLKEGDFGFARLQQGLSNGEPSTIFRRFMLTSGDHNKNYSLGYDIEEVNNLMESANKELDVNNLETIYDKVQELSTTTYPVFPLFNDVNIMGYSNKLSNYNAELYGLELPEVEWTK
ncbi:MAG: ABC transporter substrate-binding protein [Tissierellia bacterium]|nr:ABC transporter substrate-binding protein [Tissierellia bacterium]